MRRALSIVILVLAAHAACFGYTSEDLSLAPAIVHFQRAYDLLQQADASLQAGRDDLALPLYGQCLELYGRLREHYPEWQPALVKFRIAYCGSKVQDLTRKAESVANAEADDYASPEPGGESDGEAMDNLLDSARASIHRPSPSQARELLMQALLRSPDHRATRLLLGIVQCQSGDFRDAAYVLEQLASDYPDDAHTQVVLAAAYSGLGRPADAIAALQRALNLNPNLPEAHYNMAQRLLSADPPNEEGARTHYRQALALGAARDEMLDRLLSAQPLEDR